MKIVRIILLALALLVLLFFAIGLLVPEVKYGSEVTVNRPPEQSFAVFMDQSRMKEWLPGLQRIEMVQGRPGEVGSTARLLVNSEGEEMEMTEKVTAFAPNRLYAFALDNDVLTGQTEIRFTPAGSGTRIRTVNVVRGKNLFWRALFPFFKGAFQENDRKVYENLKGVIEQS